MPAGRARTSATLVVDDWDATSLTVEALPVGYAGTYPYTVLDFGSGTARVVLGTGYDDATFTWRDPLTALDAVGDTVLWSTGALAGSVVTLAAMPELAQAVCIHVPTSSWDVEAIGDPAVEQSFSEELEGVVTVQRQYQIATARPAANATAAQRAAYQVAVTAEIDAEVIACLEAGEQARETVQAALRIGSLPSVWTVMVDQLALTNERAEDDEQPGWITTAGLSWSCRRW